MMKRYTPVIFPAIAKQVATGASEQYLTAFRQGGITVMFSTPAIEEAITKASAQFSDQFAEPRGTDIITFECNAKHFVDGNYMFHDSFKGVMKVDGVLVEVSVRKLMDDVHRVLFSRVDAAEIYGNLSQRVEQLEKTVRELQLTPVG